jgi:hypothetical protein
MITNFEDLEDLFKREKLHEWDKWLPEIPYINFPSSWDVKIIPPFRGAICRFRVKLKNVENDENFISVYLDCYDQLGFFGEPYWEIFPIQSGDVYKIKMNDVDKLVKKITEALQDLS